MRLLHTSDWHIGRTFHGHSTIEHIRIVLEALIGIVRDRRVDVVVVSGDIFDSATPAAESYTVLTSMLVRLREAGATVVVTSGNHDSATRLGFQSEFASLAGIHVITRFADLDKPVTVSDAHGPVHIYGIPYLEPSLIRHLAGPGADGAGVRTHEQALTVAMSRIRSDLARRPGRSVVLSHCFASGIAAAGEASEVERDITSGGLDLVPASVFDGPDYVALGHIHGRSRVSERIRYSGAPLHYSFSEAGKPRGVWLVELGQPGAAGDIEWVDLPVPRTLTVLTGPLDYLLEDPAHRAHEGDWVSAVLTDQSRPLDGMRRLQGRFPWCVTLEHRPTLRAETGMLNYTERLRGKSDHEIVADFLEFVRNGVGPTSFERDAIAGAITDRDVAESAA